MNRIRIFIVFGLAVTVGGVFAYATHNYVQNAQARGASMATRPVVIAAADLEIGTELRREDVRVIDWPSAAVPAAAFANPDELVGRGLVLPGTHVDVVATVSPSEQRGDMTSKVILTNVQVLAAGTKIDQDNEKNKPMPVSVVTLLVDPEESERLTLASTEGKIQLALRNPLDKAIVSTRGIKPAVLMGVAPVRTAVNRGRLSSPTGVAPSAPVIQSAPELPTVEIIRGDKRAHEVVRQEN